MVTFFTREKVLIPTIPEEKPVAVENFISIRDLPDETFDDESYEDIPLNHYRDPIATYEKARKFFLTDIGGTNIIRNDLPDLHEANKQARLLKKTVITWKETITGKIVKMAVTGVNYVVLRKLIYASQ